jgi:Flp pilus assembly protein TadB
MVIVAGAWLACSGLVPREARSGRSVPRIISAPTTSTPASKVRVEQAVGALVLGSVMLVLTRWPVAAGGIAIAGWIIVGWARRETSRAYEARTDAIAEWAEMLRDGIGTARGIEGVLVATGPTAPIPIRPAVARMAGRLPYESLADVLDDLADDLNHPIGDLVVTALRMASKAGGRQIREVLTDLAESAHGEASAYRRISVARKRPIATMRLTSILILAFILILVLVSRPYLAPYGTFTGQIMLLLIVGGWGSGFWWMARMARPAVVPRYLAATREAQP